MWVVYHKPSRNVAGLTANAERDLDKDTALNEVVQGLLEKDALQSYDAILVQDQDKAAEYLTAFPGKLFLAQNEDGSLRPVIREPEKFSLWISCDAPKKHPVDRIPMIAGDGTSFTTITIKKIDERSTLQRGERHNNVLYLRTDHGSIWDATGAKEIGSVQLQDGQAAIRLVSEPIKRVATVQMLTVDPDLPSTTYRVEFE
jgi:hypothetical protein